MTVFKNARQKVNFDNLWRRPATTGNPSPLPVLLKGEVSAPTFVISIFTHAKQNKTKKKSSCKHISFQAQQLHVKDEGGIWWDDAWVAFSSVGKVRGAGQLGPLTDAHLQGRRRSVGVWPAFWLLIKLPLKIQMDTRFITHAEG